MRLGYLDYRPLTRRRADELPGCSEPAVAAVMERPECAWITGDLEQGAPLNTP